MVLHQKTRVVWERVPDMERNEMSVCVVTGGRMPHTLRTRVRASAVRNMPK